MRWRVWSLVPALLLATSTSSALTVRTDRPRLFLSNGTGVGTTVAELKTRCADTTNYAGCMASLGTPSGGPESYAAAYIVTGNAAACATAVSTMKSSVVLPTGVASSGGDAHTYTSNNGGQMFSLAVTRDWCDAALAPADAAWLETTIAAITDWYVAYAASGLDVYHDDMPNVWSAIALAGLTLKGTSQDTKASSYLSAADTQWKTVIFPAMAYEGDYWHEGMTYVQVSLGLMAWYALGWSTGTDDNIYDWAKTNAADLFDGYIDFLSYTLRPDYNYAYFGDTSDNKQSVQLFSRYLVDLFTIGTGSTLGQGFSLEIAKNSPAYYDYAGDVRWKIALLFDATKNASAVARSTLPTGRWMSQKAQDVASLRSGWGPDDVFVYMTCGDYFGAHQHIESGSLQIARDGILTGPTGYYDNYGTTHWYNYYSQHSVHSNTLAIQDPGESFPNESTDSCAGQPEVNEGGQRPVQRDKMCDSFPNPDLPTYLKHVSGPPYNETGNMTAFQTTSCFDYVGCNVTAAYSSPGYLIDGNMAKANEVSRQLVFLHPELVVVFDRVESTDASFEKRFLLHDSMPGESPTVTGQSFRITNPKGAELFGQTLLPADATLTTVTNFDVAGMPYPPSMGGQRIGRRANRSRCEDGQHPRLLPARLRRRPRGGRGAYVHGHPGQRVGDGLDRRWQEHLRRSIREERRARRTRDRDPEERRCGHVRRAARGGLERRRRRCGRRLRGCDGRRQRDPGSRRRYRKPFAGRRVIVSVAIGSLRIERRVRVQRAHRFAAALAAPPDRGVRVPRARSAQALGPLPLADDEEFALGHLLDGEADTLAAQAGVAYAAVGHRVDAEGRGVVHDEATDVHPRERLRHAGARVGKDTRLQAVACSVGHRERLVPRVVAVHRQYGPEHLFVDDLEPEARAVDLDDCRPVAVSVPPRAAEHARSGGARLAHPLLDALGIGFVDHRPAHGGRVERRLRLDGPCLFDDLRDELVGDRPVNVETLHLDAHLPRVAEGARHHPIGSPLERRVVVHDHRRVSAKLEKHALLAGDGLQVPPHGGAARERQRGEPVVAHELLRDRHVARHHLHGVVRGPCLADALGQQEGGEGTLRRGLQHDRATARERRRELVGDEVEREVEGRERDDGTGRHAGPHSGIAARRRRRIERHHFAPDARGLLGAKPERRLRACDFCSSLRDGLSGLPRDEVCEGLLAGLDLPDDARKHGLSLVAALRPQPIERADTRRDRLFGPRFVRHHHAPELGPRPGLAHDHRGPFLDSTRRNAKGPVRRIRHAQSLADLHHRAAAGAADAGAGHHGDVDAHRGGRGCGDGRVGARERLAAGAADVCGDAGTRRGKGRGGLRGERALRLHGADDRREVRRQGRHQGLHIGGCARAALELRRRRGARRRERGVAAAACLAVRRRIAHRGSDLPLALGCSHHHAAPASAGGHPAAHDAARRRDFAIAIAHALAGAVAMRGRARRVVAFRVALAAARAHARGAADHRRRVVRRGARAGAVAHARPFAVDLRQRARHALAGAIGFAGSLALSLDRCRALARRVRLAHAAALARKISRLARHGDVRRCTAPARAALPSQVASASALT